MLQFGPLPGNTLASASAYPIGSSQDPFWTSPWLLYSFGHVSSCIYYTDL